MTLSADAMMSRMSIFNYYELRSMVENVSSFDQMSEEDIAHVGKLIFGNRPTLVHVKVCLKLLISKPGVGRVMIGTMQAFRDFDAALSQEDRAEVENLWIDNPTWTDQNRLEYAYIVNEGNKFQVMLNEAYSAYIVSVSQSV